MEKDKVEEIKELLNDCSKEEMEEIQSEIEARLMAMEDDERR
jgi:hypothetical protein